MGFLKDLVGIAAPIAGTFLGGPVGGALGGALGGLVSGSGQPKSTTSTQQQKMDPRMEQILFGGGGQQGLLSQFQGMLNAPRSDAANAFAGANANYLSQVGGHDLGEIRHAALQSMNGNGAPTSTAAQSAGPAGVTAPTTYAEQISNPAFMQGNMVQAPSQNNLNLSASFDSLINGPAGANPYLTGAIQKGINQSTNAFGNMITDAKAATQDVLGNIRGNSVLAGQYGGSRQGLAEGKAIESMNTNLARAASQFGQNNTDAAVAAQAGAYDADRNRQLAATQGLSGQQYATAFKDTDTRNMAELTNVNMVNNLLGTNTALRQQTSQANADRQQQANLYNAGQTQQNNQFNAGLQQQTGLANQQAQLSTNAQNNGALLGGAGLLSGLLGQVQGTVNQNDNWALNRAQGVNSLLAPYLGANSSTTNTQPLYSNPTGNAIAGLGMGAQLGGLFGGSTGSSPGPLDGLMKFFNAGPGVIG